VVEGLQVGRTFDPEQPASIAAAVNAILEDPAEHARVRDNALRAASGFSWEAEVATLLDAYASLEAQA
jgi:glycosyltransferase involved in cell wall biosynthesis